MTEARSGTVRAVLLDLGGPVLNEEAEYAGWSAFLVGALAREGRPVRDGDFDQEVRSGIVSCDPNAYLAAVWTFVRPDVDRFRRVRDAFREHRRVFNANLRGVHVRPEATTVIPTLADRYTLAIAANQPVSVLRLLEEANLLRYFRWGHVSDGMGIAKPAPLFFRMILDGLGVAAEEAVMVGDRLDFDIYPAKLLGMKTVRVLVGPYADQAPPTPLHVPDFTVAALAELSAALGSLG